MGSNFNILPLEIQQKIFEKLYDDYSDICECMLVCGRWKPLCEKLLYSKVAFYEFSQLTKFLDTLKANQLLQTLVEELRLRFRINYRDHRQNSTVANLFTLLPNLKSIDCSIGLYFKILLDALLANKLQRLKHIEPPHHDIERHDYITCAALMKDRIKNLHLSKLIDMGTNEISDESIRFHRLLNMLDQFKNLTAVHIQKRKSDCTIDILEKVTHYCPLLQHLYLEFLTFSNKKTRKVSVTSAVISNFTPAPNVKKLSIYGTVFDDPQFLQYIIHKFPRLKTLEASGQEVQSFYLDEFTLSKLLEYLAEIECVTVPVIVPCREQSITEFIGSSWRTLSQTRTLSVQFWYSSNDLVTIGVESTHKLSEHNIYYPYHDYNLNHIDVLERYGVYVDTLTLNSIESRTSQKFENTRYDLLILQTLKHCTKLKQLAISSSTLIGTDITSCEIKQKVKLDRLRFTNCIIDESGFFEKLSEHFSIVKHLELYGIDFMNKKEDSKGPYGKINMAKTDIGKLSLRKNPWNNDGRVRVILVKLSIQEVESYYMYLLESMNSLEFIHIGKEEYIRQENSGECFFIGINCKSLEVLKVTHLGEEITLKIN